MPRSTPDQLAFRLDEKAGWYRAEDGKLWMITWGADGSLTINDFAACENGSPIPKTTGLFTGKSSVAKQELPVGFQRGPEENISGRTWTAPGGQKKIATSLGPYGYSQSEVLFRSGRVELAELLPRPLSEGPYPAIAFIHGSGVGDRDILRYSSIADYLGSAAWSFSFPTSGDAASPAASGTRRASTRFFVNLRRKGTFTKSEAYPGSPSRSPRKTSWLSRPMDLCSKGRASGRNPAAAIESIQVARGNRPRRCRSWTASTCPLPWCSR